MFDWYKVTIARAVVTSLPAKYVLHSLADDPGALGGGVSSRDNACIRLAIPVSLCKWSDRSGRTTKVRTDVGYTGVQQGGRHA